MARICPQCSQENYDQSVFCSRCGFSFSPAEDVTPLNNAVPAPTPATTPNAAYSGYAAQAKPPQSGTPQSYGPSQSSPAAGPAPYMPQPSPADGSALYALQPGGSAWQPGAPPHASQTSDPYGAPGGVYQQQQQVPFPNMQPPSGQQHPGMQLPLGQQHPGMQPPQGQQYPGMQFPQGQPYYQPGGQRSPGQGLSVVQRAFAGKGTPLMHTSWLLDGEQVSPADIRSAIVEKAQQRYPNEVKVSQERLSERDSVLEERDYVRIERAPANVFIYVTPFGSDLYISRTTTVQPALSPVRIAVLGALFLLMLIGFIVSAASASSTIASLFSALLLIFFVVLAIHSLILGLTEKDFLVYLRPNVLNDFRIDDGAILEHIADRSIRAAAEELKLDASTLSTPVRNYPARQPLHLI